jgi:hypothetical protein
MSSANVEKVEEILEQIDDSSKPSLQRRRDSNVVRGIIDSAHLSALVSSYNVHFAAYSEGRKQVTQLIPSKVWKLVC